MNDLIAYCGLDCEKCAARLATVNNDEALRKKVAREWSELNGADITPDMINCEGCRVNGVKTVFCRSMCRIRQCASGRGVVSCGSCAEFGACALIKQLCTDEPGAPEGRGA